MWPCHDHSDAPLLQYSNKPLLTAEISDVSPSNVTFGNHHCCGRDFSQTVHCTVLCRLKGCAELGSACLTPRLMDYKTIYRISRAICVSSSMRRVWAGSMSPIATDDGEDVGKANVVLDLERITAGSSGVVRHASREWRMDIKELQVNDGTLEWVRLILTSNMILKIPFPAWVACALKLTSSDMAPLQESAVDMDKLPDRSEDDPAHICSNDQGVISSCSPFLAPVRRQRCDKDGSLSFGNLYLDCSIIGLGNGWVNITNRGHSSLIPYRKQTGKHGPECTLEWFNRVLDIYSTDDIRRATTQANLAMVRLIRDRLLISKTSSSAVPLSFHHDLPATHSTSHTDRPYASIQLAGLHLARFKRRENIDDGLQVSVLLQELSTAGNHLNKAVLFKPQLRTGFTDLFIHGKLLSVVRYAIPSSTDRNRWTWIKWLLQRFDQFGNMEDLQQAIFVAKASIGSTVSRNSAHLGSLSNLGVALLKRHYHLGELHDLEEAISFCRKAVYFARTGDPQKHLFLGNLGCTLVARFKCSGKPVDLDEAISRQRDAIHLTPDNNFHMPEQLGNLCVYLSMRFEHSGKPDDLEEAISRSQDAIRLTPNHHHYKPVISDNFSRVLMMRFQHLGGLEDLGEAIQKQRDTIHLISDGHPRLHEFSNNLCRSLLARFDRLGEMHDLEEAILKLRDIVRLTSDGRPCKTGHLTVLVNCLKTRFQRCKELDDLEEAVLMSQDAVRLTPETDHSMKSIVLNNLCTCLGMRFERLGQLGDLENIVSKQQDALRFMPESHPERPLRLFTLGTALRIRFQCLEKLEDLVDAVSRTQDAICLTPDDQPHKAMWINTLGIYLLMRFQRLGKRDDLEEAILRQQDAIRLTSDGHPFKSKFIGDLFASLKTSFECIKEPDDLEKTILAHRTAVCLTPNDHLAKPAMLNNLGACLGLRFARLGRFGDLEEMISRRQDAIHLIPNSHPDKPLFFSDLGASLRTRFEHLGKLDDLGEAISMLLTAVNLTPDNHPNKHSYLNKLGNALANRFERHGELNDLQEAITRQRDAICLIPDGHRNNDTPSFLNSLSTFFKIRFEHLGELTDLEEALSKHLDVIYLTPDTHKEKPMYLSNLGNDFITRFEKLGELHDLEEGVSRHRAAVHLLTSANESRDYSARHSILLNNLASALDTRYVHLGKLDDLEEAILMNRGTVHLTPDHHPNKPTYLRNLSRTLKTRFKHLGDLEDLEEAISGLHNVVRLTPDDHLNKPGYLNALGDSVFARFECLGVQDDLENAVLQYSNAACFSIGSIYARFDASKKWIKCARLLQHHTLLGAYSISLALFPQLAWIGLPLAHRYRELKQGADLVREAAAAALDSGFPELAVEWLEQGRSVVWGELFQLRSSFDELSSAYPNHARRLCELSTALEHASSARKERSLNEALATKLSAAELEFLQERADKHRQLAIERDRVLREIRTLPGFERFLLHKEFSHLRASAHAGPVVFLNAAETRCDALIVLADVNHVIHVSLPSFSITRCQEMESALNKLVGPLRGMPRQNRYGKPPEQSKDVKWRSILSPLWKCVVKPVLDALALSVTSHRELPRIFWCPTGPFTFLPIHAAGFYDKDHSGPGHKVYDYVVSSYVPTLSILAPSSEPDATRNDDIRLLAVGQPLSDGQRRLPGVITELEHIKTVIDACPHPSITLRESTLGTVEGVLGLMKVTNWVHFACHGIQDGMNPIESGLCLADGRRLKVSDMTSISRPRGGLAFLSACQTATGDEDLSDEAIHIAAGMLFSGYGGVIGTMWSISDRIAPELAKGVYQQLFGEGSGGDRKIPDYREAARALHDAVGRLRDRNESFLDWLPFIHVGL